MITYKEYLKTKHKELPKVHFGISDRMRLTESDNSTEDDLVDKAHDALSSHYHEDKFSKDHREAVGAYTGFNAINHNLLHGSLAPDESKTVEHLDNIVSKVKTPNALTVYTGTDESHAHALQNHDVVHHTAFLSTSIDRSVATRFAGDKTGDVVAIHLPKDHAGAYIAHISTHKSEREFVLPRNMKLKIDHSEREVISHADSEPMYLHHAYPVTE
jgi:hypothetical protein